MTINLTRWFGINLRRMPDANGRPGLAIVIWYPRGRGLLGYLYPSIPWF